MKLSQLTVIFIIIIIPIVLLTSFYISTGLKTIKYQALYNTGLLTATHDAIYAFEKNTINNAYSDNAETKRNILKSSVKAFEKSLCSTCGISAFNTNEIEEYVPALVFGMYDGFYIYAPSYNSQTRKYEHGLKNYVYYSEMLDDGTCITYSLDNYVIVSGEFDGEYIVKEGYLIDLEGSLENGTKYKGINIDNKEDSAIKYYKEAYYFTNWFLNEARIQDKRKNNNIADFLNIGTSNDPEDENSPFIQHKRSIMKEKIEGVLNSTITAYSKRTWNQNYKMPKLSEEDWERIYNNISMISFFQGKQVGFSKFNGYCVLNSTNSNEYVNPNLIYFINDEDGAYHDIRCTDLESIDKNINGYKIGIFSKKREEETDEQGNVIVKHKYTHNELACYNCINGQLGKTQTIRDYISISGNENIKTSYWTALARERYNTPKLIDTSGVITYKLEGLTASNNQFVIKLGESYTTYISPINTLIHRRPENITVIMNGEVLEQGYTYNNYNGQIIIPEIKGDIIIIANTTEDTSNKSFSHPSTTEDSNYEEIQAGTKWKIINTKIDQKQTVRVYEFIAPSAGTYKFWSDDHNADTNDVDPYAYLYDGDKYSIDVFNSIIIEYANYQSLDGNPWFDANELFDNEEKIKAEVYNDDGGEGYNFYMQYECTQNKKYYLVIRTYSPYETQTFSQMYIEKIN